MIAVVVSKLVINLAHEKRQAYPSSRERGDRTNSRRLLLYKKRKLDGFIQWNFLYFQKKLNCRDTFCWDAATASLTNA
jgi:hypothetical protein